MWRIVFIHRCNSTRLGPIKIKLWIGLIGRLTELLRVTKARDKHLCSLTSSYIQTSLKLHLSSVHLIIDHQFIPPCWCHGPICYFWVFLILGLLVSRVNLVTTTGIFRANSHLLHQVLKWGQAFFLNRNSHKTSHKETWLSSDLFRLSDLKIPKTLGL